MPVYKAKQLTKYLSDSFYIVSKKQKHLKFDAILFFVYQSDDIQCFQCIKFYYLQLSSSSFSATCKIFLKNFTKYIFIYVSMPKFFDFLYGSTLYGVCTICTLMYTVSPLSTRVIERQLVLLICCVDNISSKHQDEKKKCS